MELTNRRRQRPRRHSLPPSIFFSPPITIALATDRALVHGPDQHATQSLPGLEGREKNAVASLSSADQRSAAAAQTKAGPVGDEDGLDSRDRMRALIQATVLRPR